MGPAFENRALSKHMGLTPGITQINAKLLALKNMVSIIQLNWTRINRFYRTGLILTFTKKDKKKYVKHA